MTEQFWYGLLAFPALLIILGAAVVIPLGALKLLGMAREWRLKKLNKTTSYKANLYSYVEDPDNRLLLVSLMATAEKLRYMNTPLGVFFYANSRYDNHAARHLESRLHKGLIAESEKRSNDST